MSDVIAECGGRRRRLAVRVEILPPIGADARDHGQTIRDRDDPFSEHPPSELLASGKGSAGEFGRGEQVVGRLGDNRPRIGAEHESIGFQQSSGPLQRSAEVVAGDGLDPVAEFSEAYQRPGDDL